jgi:Predicted nucleic acid-binding protein, consists of a PIN domain and a Zn-ribbon module
MKIVVDASSLFYGFQVEGSNEYMITSAVLDEVKGRKMKGSLETVIELFKIIEPDKSTIEEVRNKAKETGDLDQLSVTDIELIALAKDSDATLLTNDLSIQNVCKRMKINYQSFGGKSINTEIEWGYRCIGCNRKFDRSFKECPHCGNELKKYPKKRRPIIDST